MWYVAHWRRLELRCKVVVGFEHVMYVASFTCMQYAIEWVGTGRSDRPDFVSYEVREGSMLLGGILRLPRC